MGFQMPFFKPHWASLRPQRRDRKEKGKENKGGGHQRKAFLRTLIKTLLSFKSTSPIASLLDSDIFREKPKKTVSKFYNG